jgi:hypothetical protein
MRFATGHAKRADQPTMPITLLDIVLIAVVLSLALAGFARGPMREAVLLVRFPVTAVLGAIIVYFVNPLHIPILALGLALSAVLVGTIILAGAVVSDNPAAAEDFSRSPFAVSPAPFLFQFAVLFVSTGLIDVLTRRWKIALIER